MRYFSIFLLSILTVAIISCDESSHIDEPTGNNTCSGVNGASVTYQNALAGYSVIQLTQDQLTQASQTNYPLVHNDTSGQDIFFFITTDDFADINNGYTVTSEGTPPSFVVDIRCI